VARLVDKMSVLPGESDIMEKNACATSTTFCSYYSKKGIITLNSNFENKNHQPWLKIGWKYEMGKLLSEQMILIHRINIRRLFPFQSVGSFSQADEMMGVSSVIGCFIAKYQRIHIHKHHKKRITKVWNTRSYFFFFFSLTTVSCKLKSYGKIYLCNCPFWRAPKLQRSSQQLL
jgi:hypothetical protein